MKNLKLFIWDFDGTLLNTYPNIIRYLHNAVNDCGYEADNLVILEKMMVNIPYAINYYSELYGISDLSERFKTYRLENEKNDPAGIFPHVKEVLERINEIGAQSYIFTNRGDSIYQLLEREGISPYFKEVITARNEHFKVKPAPDVIFYLMEKYGGTPENTVMIGDRVCDLEAGYNAGCKTIHLLTPAVPQYPPCDWRISNFKEMLDVLK
ncbi:MAG: HAD-IA family hydrolase [Clostridia bacterium]|nr:HAD-IA family hydrolase [Clostridia bacterium]